MKIIYIILLTVSLSFNAYANDDVCNPSRDSFSSFIKENIKEILLKSIKNYAEEFNFKVKEGSQNISIGDIEAITWTLWGTPEGSRVETSVDSLRYKHSSSISFSFEMASKNSNDFYSMSFINPLYAANSSDFPNNIYISIYSVRPQYDEIGAPIDNQKSCEISLNYASDGFSGNDDLLFRIKNEDTGVFLSNDCKLIKKGFGFPSN